MKNKYKTFSDKHFSIETRWTISPSTSDERKLNGIFKKAIFLFEEFISYKKGLGIKSSQIDLSVTICGNQMIRTLNRNYRNKDKKTDVLSFPVHETLRDKNAVDQIQFLSLGDIFISLDVAKKQAKDYDATIEEEFARLLIHGFLHLCGFDHEISPYEEGIMREKEENILKKFFRTVV